MSEAEKPNAERLRCIHCNSGNLPTGHLYHLTDDDRPTCGKCVCAECQELRAASVLGAARQPLPDYCFECDDTSRCASTEICLAGHSGYPNNTAPVSLEKLRELEALRDEMWKASDNRFAANYAIQTPGEFAGYVIPADKAQEWADRLQAVLAEFEKEGK